MAYAAVPLHGNKVRTDGLPGDGYGASVGKTETDGFVRDPEGGHNGTAVCLQYAGEPVSRPAVNEVVPVHAFGGFNGGCVRLRGG